jgi:hypothetical protein
VALCHLQTEQLERRFGVSKTDVSGNGRPRAQKRSTPATHAAIDRGIRIQPVR